MASSEGSFWDHLEVLRGAIIRSLAVVTVIAVAVFMLKDFVFEYVVFYPTNENFPTFRLMRRVMVALGYDVGINDIQPVKIISTRLAAQLFTHLSMSFYIALVIGVPYLSGEVWMFVRPALYQKEKKFMFKALIYTGLLFYLGVMVSYFMIFPLSVNFLAAYQVTPDIENLISIDSYIDTLVELCLATGLSFELPVAAYFLARDGILTHSFLKRYRRHAFVAVLVLAAIITPSTDIFTMMITALPLYCVFELSVAVVKRAEKKNLAD